MNGERSPHWDSRTIHGVRPGSQSLIVNRLGRGKEGQVAYLTSDKKLYIHKTGVWIAINVDIDGQYNDVEQDILALSTRITSNDTDISEVQSKVVLLGSALTREILKISTNTSDISDLSSDVLNNSTTISNIQTGLTDLTSDVLYNSTNIANNIQSVQSLDTRMGVAETDMDALQLNVAALQLIDTVDSTHPGAVELDLSGNKLTINAPIHGFTFTTVDQTPPPVDIGNVDDIKLAIDLDVQSLLPTRRRLLSYDTSSSQCVDIRDWSQIQNKPTDFPPTSHNHDSVYLKISDYQAGQIVNWADIANKPSTFTPISHTHVISDVTNLQTSLDGKAPTIHNHDSVYLKISDYQAGQSGNWEDIANKPTVFPPSNHSHNIGDIIDLQAVLDSKLEGSHHHDDRYALIDHVHTEYITQVDVSNNYLTIVDASNNYLKQLDASDNYLTLVDASDNYLTRQDASDNYLKISNYSD